MKLDMWTGNCDVVSTRSNVIMTLLFVFRVIEVLHGRGFVEFGVESI